MVSSASCLCRKGTRCKSCTVCSAGNACTSVHLTPTARRGACGTGCEKPKTLADLRLERSVPAAAASASSKTEIAVVDSSKCCGTSSFSITSLHTLLVSLPLTEHNGGTVTEEGKVGADVRIRTTGVPMPGSCLTTLNYNNFDTPFRSTAHGMVWSHASVGPLRIQP